MQLSKRKYFNLCKCMFCVSFLLFCNSVSDSKKNCKKDRVAFYDASSDGCTKIGFGLWYSFGCGSNGDTLIEFYSNKQCNKQYMGGSMNEILVKKGCSKNSKDDGDDDGDDHLFVVFLVHSFN